MIAEYAWSIGAIVVGMAALVGLVGLSRRAAKARQAARRCDDVDCSCCHPPHLWEDR